MADAGFDLAFSIRISHAARQSDRAVMLQHIAIKRVDLGVIDVRRQHALAKIIQNHHARGSAQSAKSFLVQLSPGLRAGAEYQQPHGFPAMAQRHHEQPRAPVLAGLRIAHHRSGAVVHLSFFARSGFNHDAGFGHGRPEQLPHEPLYAGIASRKTVAVHQVLPDGHRVATLRQFGFNDLPVGFAGARRWAAARWLRCLFGRRVGGHLYGRFWRIPSPPARRTHRDSRSPEICPGGFAAKMRRFLNAPQRPAHSPQRDDLLFLFFAQDIAHVTESNLPARFNVPIQLPSLAGFQVSTDGRFWVSTEVRLCRLLGHGHVGPVCDLDTQSPAGGAEQNRVR